MSLFVTWFERIRSMRVAEALGLTLVFGVLARFLLFLGTGGRALSWYDLVFQTWPVTLACTVALIVIGMRWNHEREERAAGMAVTTLCLGLIIGILFSFTGLFSDGTSSPFVSPVLAIVSVLWGGLFPREAGPDIFLRVLPLVSSITVAVRLHVFRAPPRHVIRLTALALGILHGIVFLPSILIGIVGLLMRLSTNSLDEMLRTFLNVSGNGFWSSFVPERFGAAAGQQTQVMVSALHASFLFILIAYGTIVTLAIKHRELFHIWLRRLLVPSALRLFLVSLVVWFAAGFARGPIRFFPDALATVLLIVALLAWSTWLLLARDLASASQDAISHPDRWIPAGVVSLHRAEEVSHIALGFSLLSASLLGLPVALPWILATVLLRIFSSQRLASVIPLILLPLSVLFTSGKEIVAPLWIMHLTESAIVTIVLAELLPTFLANRSHRSSLAIASALLVFSVALTAQPILWMSTLPLLVLLLVFGSSRPDLFSRFLPRLFEGTLVLYLIVFLIFPRFLER